MKTQHYSFFLSKSTNNSIKLRVHPAYYILSPFMLCLQQLSVVAKIANKRNLSYTCLDPFSGMAT